MDEAGRIASVTDPYGKTVGYEWGSMGESRRIRTRRAADWRLVNIYYFINIFQTA